MANKKGVLRTDLESARRLAAKQLENLKKSPPDLVAYWQREWRDAQAEVRRLQREIAS